MSDSVASDTATSCLLVPWRVVETGARWLSAVVNVSFDLRGGPLARLVAARPLAETDRLPFKVHAEVVVVGVPRATDAVRVVGLGVARGRTILLQKRLVFRGGATTPETNGGELWEVEDANARGRFRRDSPIALPRDEDGEQLVSTAEDLHRLQLADSDQWLSAIEGGERVRLTGWDGGELDVRLPDVEPRVRIGPHAVPMTCDTIELDASRGVATLTFRGAIPRRGNDDQEITAALGPRIGNTVLGNPSAWAKERRSAPSPAVDIAVIEDRSGFACWTMRWSPAPNQLRRVLVVKGTFDLTDDGGALRPSPEQAPLEPEQIGASDEDGTRASDFAPIKPRVDVVVHAAAHGGGGKTLVPVTIEVGGSVVELVAMGPRQFQSQGIPGPPADLESLPLRWGYAFGGPGVAENPIGTGAAPGSSPPRIEEAGALMRAFGDRPSPAGVAPVPSTWPIRTRLLGTFDSAWEQERWPHLPMDFDPEHHQSAAPKLRLDSLGSGARVRLTNVRPGGAPLIFTLPDIAPRAFVFREGHEPLALSLRLDTVTIDVEAGKVFLVWRANYEIAVRARPAERIEVVRESTQSPLSADAILALLAVGRDPTWAERVRAVSDPLPVTVREIEKRFVLAAETHARSAEPSEDRSPVPLDAAALERLVRDGRSLRGRDLTRAKLAGADLRNLDMRGAILRGATLTGARLDGANLEGAVLSQARASQVKLDGASLRRADFAYADLSQASFRGAHVDNASFARAELEMSVFDGAKGNAASFIGARMSKVSADAAELPKADYTDARLEESRFRKADLEGATFQETDASSACFDDSRLQNVRFELARCGSASFERADARGSTWDAADLTGASLARAELGGAVFGATTLISANLQAVRAESARFREADLTGSDLRDAHLKGASFESACLNGALLERANLDEANLTLASLTGARLDGTFLETAIPRRRSAR